MTAALPAAPQSEAQEGATITPNYKDADLSQIIQAVSEVTGKNFIIDPRVNAKVTMLSATPDVTGGILRSVFGGIAGVWLCGGAGRQGHQNRAEHRCRGNCRPIDLPNNVSSTSDEIVTQIVTLKNVNAAQLVPMLRPLVPPYGHLAAYPGRQHADHLGSRQQCEPHGAHHPAHGRERR